MYNSIYPININYRKTNPYQKQNLNTDTSGKEDQPALKQDTYTPSSNKINISQILTDFKNTIAAINAPEDVQDEVNIYLNLVEKESKKETPSRDIILSNLKNASKISDSYIASALGKPSNVVEGWITTIFKQDIDLKSNPNEINPDFLLKFPTKPKADSVSISQENTLPSSVEIKEETIPETPQVIEEETNEGIKITNLEDIPDKSSSLNITVDSSIDSAQDDEITQETEEEVKENNTKPKTPFSPHTEGDEKAKVLYMQAKRISTSKDNSIDALNMLNEALGYMSGDSNTNIKAAIHFERAKIFDEYDYVDYALRDFHEATKADDLNLKANAFYKSGLIYDEFKEYDPAVDNYLSSVAYSGEAGNLSAQSRVLSKISQMYAQIYDAQNAHDYADLAIDAALDSDDSKVIANTYSLIAGNYQKLGDKKSALEHYKNALAEFSRNNESYEQMAHNYSQASILMRELGNEAKAEKLQAKANQYYQKARLQLEQQELAS